MSEPKFTPGPWFSVTRLSGSENHRGFNICGDDGWALADIQPVDEDGIEGRANAHLIAAAPELYKALDHYADQYCEGWCKESEGLFEDCGGCKARAALAKARGE